MISQAGLCLTRQGSLVNHEFCANKQKQAKTRFVANWLQRDGSSTLFLQIQHQHKGFWLSAEKVT